MSKFTGRRNYGWAERSIEDQRWVDSSQQRQDIRDALDGYADEYVELVTITSNYTIEQWDVVILCNGTLTVTMPSAIGLSGKKYYIKNIGTGVVTVSAGTETIDDGHTAVLESQYEAIDIVSNGVGWFII